MKQKENEEWVALIDKKELEQAILLYCQAQQANTTPFGSGHLAELMGHSGLSEAGNQILKGTLFENYDKEVYPELKTFISELAMPKELLLVTRFLGR